MLQEALYSHLQCMLRETWESLGHCSRQEINKSLSCACCRRALYSHLQCMLQENLKSLEYCSRQGSNNPCRLHAAGSIVQSVSFAMHVARGLEIPGILHKARDQQFPVICMLQEASCLPAGEAEVSGILHEAGELQIPVFLHAAETLYSLSSAVHAAGDFEVPGILHKAGEQQVPSYAWCRNWCYTSCYCQLFHAENRQPGMVLSAQLQKQSP